MIRIEICKLLVTRDANTIKKCASEKGEKKMKIFVAAKHVTEKGIRDFGTVM